ncbi:MAG: phosphoribosyltransferase family protein [Eubacteriales bacterium]|nr:phosphoribosyltransferase family protein [Eubacteriales bacterium]
MSVLFPARCIFCGGWISEQQHGICVDCREQAEAEMKTVYCTPTEGTDAVICAGRYQRDLRQALIHMKFHQYGNQVLGPLAELMQQAWELHHMPQPDVITCVPVSQLRVHTRGYNQSAEFAKYLAESWQVPFEPMLKRHLFSKRQSSLQASARWDNAKKSYCLRSGVKLEGKSVLLVDDIVTTGATADICALLLKQAGATAVWVLAAAKTGA